VASVLSQANSEDAAEYRLHPFAKKRPPKVTQQRRMSKSKGKLMATNETTATNIYQLHLQHVMGMQRRSIALGKVQLSPAVSVVASKARK